MAPRSTATSTKPTLAGWKSKARHYITLQSGFVVGIEIPNLPLLVKTGQLPNELVTHALDTIKTGAMTPELVAEQSEFYDKLVAATVKEPELTEEDVHTLPYEDVELIVEIATRQRDVDAVGHHIAGLHTSREWRKFRGLDYSDAAMEGLRGGGEAVA